MPRRRDLSSSCNKKQQKFEHPILILIFLLFFSTTENLPPLQNERGESNDKDDDDDDDDDDDGEPIVPADRDAQVPRTEVVSLLDGKGLVLHEWGDHLRLYHAGGVIKNGEEKNIDV